MAKYSVLKKFYDSKEWGNFRISLIIERGPVCEICKKLIINQIEIIGHHIIELTPENVFDYEISLNPNHVILVCFDCHNKEHKRYGYNTKEVHLVYGAPMAGKKTFVKQNIQHGDIVVNIDMLYSAVTMLPEYDKPDKLFSNVIGIYNVLIDNIKTRHGKWNTAWIIGGYPERYKREKLITDLGAEPIFIQTSKEECKARLMQREELKYRVKEWEGYIDKWFDEYTA